MSANFKWNQKAADQVAAEAMRDLARRGRQRLSAITCPVHGSTHRVTWTVRGTNIDVGVDDACCDELEHVLQAETERAAR